MSRCGCQPACWQGRACPLQADAALIALSAGLYLACSQAVLHADPILPSTCSACSAGAAQGDAGGRAGHGHCGHGGVHVPRGGQVGGDRAAG